MVVNAVFQRLSQDHFHLRASLGYRLRRSQNKANRRKEEQASIPRGTHPRAWVQLPSVTVIEKPMPMSSVCSMFS